MSELRLMTRRRAKEAKATLRMHLHLTGGRHVYNYELVEFPGFIVSKVYDKKTGRTTRTYYVEGCEEEFDDLAVAGRVWNELALDRAKRAA